MIQEVLNLFPEYTVEPRLKECLITYKDKYNEDDFDLPSIRDKLIKMESLKANCRISMIPCDIRIKKDFYSLAQKIVQPNTDRVADIKIKRLLEDLNNLINKKL